MTRKDMIPARVSASEAERLAHGLATERVNAIREELRSLVRAQSASNESLVIRTYGSDHTQKIFWEKLGDCQGDAHWEVFGFRREGSFHADPWSHTENGECIAHSYADDASVVDHVLPGGTYAYTFLLMNHSRNQKADWLRFKVIVPSTTEREEQLQGLLRVHQLETQYKATLEPQRPPTDRRQKYIDDLLKDVHYMVAIRQAGRDALEAIKDTPYYRQSSLEEQEELLQNVAERFDPKEFELLP